MALVEPGKQPEKLTQPSIILILSRYSSEFVQHVHEVSHYEGKSRDTAKKDEGSDDALRIAHWAEITIAD